MFVALEQQKHNADKMKEKSEILQRNYENCTITNVYFGRMMLQQIYKRNYFSAIVYRSNRQLLLTVDYRFHANQGIIFCWNCLADSGIHFRPRDCYIQTVPDVVWQLHVKCWV